MNIQDRIELEIDQHVAVVRFNRPEKMNALDMVTFSAILEAQETISADPDIRAVVLSARGEHFCAGLDVQAVMSDPSAIETLLSKSPDKSWAGNYVQQAAIGWQQLEVPVVAALNGYVFGGGLQIAAGADFRIAHPQSQWSIMEIRWGIIPDMGISVTAAGTCNPDQLKLMAMTGQRISGEEAYNSGLVTQLASHPESAAIEIARTIASNNPDAVKAVKTLFNTDHATAEDSLQQEENLQKTLLFSANQLEAVQANIQKRTPEFS